MLRRSRLTRSRATSGNQGVARQHRLGRRRLRQLDGRSGDQHLQARTCSETSTRSLTGVAGRASTSSTSRRSPGLAGTTTSASTQHSTTAPRPSTRISRETTSRACRPDNRGYSRASTRPRTTQTYSRACLSGHGELRSQPLRLVQTISVGLVKVTRPPSLRGGRVRPEDARACEDLGMGFCIWVADDPELADALSPYGSDPQVEPVPSNYPYFSASMRAMSA